MKRESLVRHIIEKALHEARFALTEPEAKTICMEYGIPTPRFEVATTADEAANYAGEIGYPIVMKIVSPQIIHKTDAGGVLIDINGPDKAKAGFETLVHNARRYDTKADIRGVLIQKMAPSGTELIIGALVDPQFGQTVMFGLGGIFAEIYKDVAFRIAPIKSDDAKEMLKEIKAYPIIAGYRGKPHMDESALVEILVNVSKLVMDYPQIVQLDLNPVLAYEVGASMVDARIILKLARPILNAQGRDARG